MRAGFARPHRSHNTFLHGARTPVPRRGADPSAAEVRLNFVHQPGAFVQTPVKEVGMGNWQQDFRVEMERAEKAREEGIERRARAAARRAANVVLGEYLRRRGISPVGMTIQQRSAIVLQERDLPERARVILRHMLMRIRPTCDFPEDIDLLSEAQELAHLLLEPAPSPPVG